MPARRSCGAHGGLVAGADLHAGARAEHLRAADEDRVEATRRARRARPRAPISAGTARSANLAGRSPSRPPESGSMTCASPQARPRRHTSARPMHEPRPDADEHVAARTRTRRARPCGRRRRSPWLWTDQSPRPIRCSSSATPAGVGSSMKDRVQASPSTSARSRGRAPARRRRCGRPGRWRRSAPSMSRDGLRRAQVELEARHRGQRADVGAAEDVADLAERGARRSRCRPRRRACAHSVPASSARERAAATVASTSPATGTTTPVTIVLGGRRRPRPRRRAAAPRRAGTESSTGRPSSARQRGAGGAGADVGQLAEGVELQVGVAERGHVLVRVLSGGAQAARARGCRSRARRSRRAGRCSPSDRTAAPETGAQLGDVGGQRAGDELALADERRDGQRDAALLALHDDGELAVVGALVAERGGGVESGSTASPTTSMRWPARGAHGVVDEADGALDAVERDRRTTRPPARTSSARHDGQRQRQADLRRSCPRRARRSAATSPPSSRTLAADGVHADAAAGDVVVVTSRGREAGREEQLDGARPCRSRRPARRR